MTAIRQLLNLIDDRGQAIFLNHKSELITKKEWLALYHEARFNIATRMKMLASLNKFAYSDMHFRIKLNSFIEKEFEDYSKFKGIDYDFSSSANISYFYV